MSRHPHRVSRERICREPADTERLASQLARHLRAGDLVALDGQLGAGKTCFARGLVEALAGAEAAEVSSPTYALLNVYPTTPPVYHVDFYRLSDVDDLETTGYWDLVAQRDGIIVLEWWRRVPDAIDDDAVRVLIEIVDGGRQITISVPEGRREMLEGPAFHAKDAKWAKDAKGP